MHVRRKYWAIAEGKMEFFVNRFVPLLAYPMLHPLHNTTLLFEMKETTRLFPPTNTRFLPVLRGCQISLFFASETARCAPALQTRPHDHRHDKGCCAIITPAPGQAILHLWQMTRSVGVCLPLPSF